MRSPLKQQQMKIVKSLLKAFGKENETTPEVFIIAYKVAKESCLRRF
jgi:hypothetical protein